eukprot:gene9678-biopygen83957
MLSRGEVSLVVRVDACELAEGAVPVGDVQHALERTPLCTVGCRSSFVPRTAVGSSPPEAKALTRIQAPAGRLVPRPKINTLPRYALRKGLLVQGKWKLHVGTMIEASWGGPQYFGMIQCYESRISNACTHALLHPNASTASDPISDHNLKCPDSGCLFDVETDPSERSEVSSQHPDVVALMSAEMKRQEATIWSASHKNGAGCTTAAHGQYGGKRWNGKSMGK